MWIERPVCADLPFEAEGDLGVGRQQEFDRRGVEADAVVEPVDPVLGVEAPDGHHRHQHLNFGDLRRIAGEQRLHGGGRRAFDDEVDPVGGNVDARNGSSISFTWAMTTPPLNAVASTMSGVSSVFAPV